MTLKVDTLENNLLQIKNQARKDKAWCSSHDYQAEASALKSKIDKIDAVLTLLGVA